MAKVYTIEPNPHWVIIDNFSRLPNGAAIYTFSNLNPTDYKPAFQDAAGTIPYGAYIPGFGNGTMPPIYWEFDDAAPTEGYYIRVYDRPKTEAGAQFLWDFNNFFGGGSGGGGTVTTVTDVQNLVVNGEFYNHSDNLASTTVSQTLAPSNHSGFFGDQPIGFAPVVPDIIFAKSNTSATDTISFVPFTPGSSDLGDNPTPEIFVKYSCTVAGNETYKVFQFPLAKGLQNTSGQEAGVRIFARLNSGINNVSLRWRQFFGNGNNAPTADVNTTISGGPLALIAGSWTEISLSNEVIPSIATKTIGNCGNDALFLQILMPQTTIDIDFILPSIYLGGEAAELDFSTEDEVNAIANSPRTGDTRTTLNTVNLGWVRMDDRTIGSTASAAAVPGTKTFPLYKLIWDTFSTNQSLAPMSGGVYGASPTDDFVANRTISLTKNLGRVMAGALPVAASETFTRSGNTLVVSSTAGFYTGMAVTPSTTLTLPSPLGAGLIYYAVVLTSTTLSLATTTANATASTPVIITLTTAGSGTMTIASVNSEVLGSFIGEETHGLGVTEMPAHSHTYSIVVSSPPDTLATGAGSTIATASTGSTGGAGSSTTTGTGAAVVPHNTIQPTVYMNVFIKL